MSDENEHELIDVTDVLEKVVSRRSEDAPREEACERFSDEEIVNGEGEKATIQHCGQGDFLETQTFQSFPENTHSHGTWFRLKQLVGFTFDLRHIEDEQGRKAVEFWCRGEHERRILAAALLWIASKLVPELAEVIDSWADESGNAWLKHFCCFAPREEFSGQEDPPNDSF